MEFMIRSYYFDESQIQNPRHPLHAVIVGMNLGFLEKKFGQTKIVFFSFQRHWMPLALPVPSGPGQEW